MSAISKLLLTRRRWSSHVLPGPRKRSEGDGRCRLATSDVPCSVDWLVFSVTIWIEDERGSGTARFLLPEYNSHGHSGSVIEDARGVFEYHRRSRTNSTARRASPAWWLHRSNRREERIRQMDELIAGSTHLDLHRFRDDVDIEIETNQIAAWQQRWVILSQNDVLFDMSNRDDFISHLHLDLSWTRQRNTLGKCSVSVSPIHWCIVDD